MPLRPSPPPLPRTYKMRRPQGYSAGMLIEESRVFQVATFGALHLHQRELDQNQVLLDVMVIADEVDAQLIACFEEERAHGFGGGDGAYGVGGVDLDKLPEDFVESFW